MGSCLYHARLKQAFSNFIEIFPWTAQAELAWVKEQLDCERSRSNGTVAHMEQRRVMMELAQQSQLVNKLQGQVTPLEAYLPPIPVS